MTDDAQENGNSLTFSETMEAIRKIVAMTEADLSNEDTLRYIIRVRPSVLAVLEQARREAVRRLCAGEEIEGLYLFMCPRHMEWKAGASQALWNAYGVKAFRPVKASDIRDRFPGGQDFVAKWTVKKPPVFSVTALDESGDAE